MQIPFTKAHGARNDFLLTWIEELKQSTESGDLPEHLPGIARAICDRYAGVGADGWMLVDSRPGIRLFNSDGSEPELSGNGTRCAAAFLIANGKAGDEMQIATGAGLKSVRIISRRELEFQLEMNMGQPRVVELHALLELMSRTVEATLMDCGNPQCAILVDNFDFDWAAIGAEIERHPRFPDRTNVSFIRPVDRNTIDVRFFERGAGVTMSSGTGSTGAAACAMALGIADSPLTVLTPAGPLKIERRERGNLYLTGPAEIIASGIYHYHK